MGKEALCVVKYPLLQRSNTPLIHERQGLHKLTTMAESSREKKSSRPISRDPFIKAYHDFKKTVDLTKGGILPDLDNLVWYLLMGVPRVPADEDSSENAPLNAIDQRVAILKATFVEANRHQNETFLDQGLKRYDQAGQMAKGMLEEAGDLSVSNDQ